ALCCCRHSTRSARNGSWSSGSTMMCCFAGLSGSASRTRYGMPRPSPKTATGCWLARWRPSFSSRCSRKTRSSACCRASISRLMARCWRLGRARKASARRMALVSRRDPAAMVRTIPWRAPPEHHARLDHRPRRPALPQRTRQRSAFVFHGPRADGEPQRVDRRCGDDPRFGLCRAPGRTGADRAARRPQPVTLGADKGYDVGDFVMELREKTVTPHVAQSTNGRRSAIDGRTTRHSGYAVSQRIRKRVEEAFGWAKTVAGLRKMRHCGLPKVGWQFTLAMAAYDLARLPRLLAQPGV